MNSNISPDRNNRKSPGLESVSEHKDDDEEAGLMDDLNDFFGRRLTEINELVAGKRRESSKATDEKKINKAKSVHSGFL